MFRLRPRTLVEKIWICSDEVLCATHSNVRLKLAARKGEDRPHLVCGCVRDATFLVIVSNFEKIPTICDGVRFAPRNSGNSLVIDWHQGSIPDRVIPLS